MTRPTLYLTNLSSKQWHGPGRKWSAMIAPRTFEQGNGRTEFCKPDYDDLRAYQAGEMSLTMYRRGFETVMEVVADGEADRENPGVGLSPGCLRAYHWVDGRCVFEAIADGDTIFCACARPGSPKRVHPCHIELLPPFLVRAGWDVMLDGAHVTLNGEDVVYRYNTATDIYRPESFGWPEAV